MSNPYPRMNKLFIVKLSIENDNTFGSIILSGVNEKEHGIVSVVLEGVFGGILGGLRT